MSALERLRAVPARIGLYRATQRTVAAACMVLCRAQIRGRENFPAQGPVIVASNHRALIDSIILSAIFPRRVSFIAKASPLNAPGLRGWAMRQVYELLGIIPVDRSSRRDAAAALDPAVEVLRAGGVFGVFPEGTRSRDGRLYRGRTGVAHAALSTGAPILPVALEGTERVQPHGSTWPRPRRFTVTLGELIEVPLAEGRQTGRQRRELTDRVMDAIAELSGQERADAFNVSGTMEGDARRG